MNRITIETFLNFLHQELRVGKRIICEGWAITLSENLQNEQRLLTRRELLKNSYSYPHRQKSFLRKPGLLFHRHHSSLLVNDDHQFLSCVSFIGCIFKKIALYSYFDLVTSIFSQQKEYYTIKTFSYNSIRFSCLKMMKKTPDIHKIK